jgi:hypothetical protein
MNLYAVDHVWGEHQHFVIAESEEHAHALTGCQRKFAKPDNPEFGWGTCSVSFLASDLSNPGVVYEHECENSPDSPRECCCEGDE